MNKELIKKELKDFIAELTGEDNIKDSTSLIDSGIIDSVNFIDLILFIEEKYNIKYTYFDFHVSDFETILALTPFILRKM